MKRVLIYSSSFIIFVLMNNLVKVAIAAPAPIVTSTQQRTSSDAQTFGIGFTSSVAERPFVGVDDQNASLLYLSYRYKKFYIEGLDIGFNLYSDKDSAVDILATPRFYEVEPSFASNGELNGIDKTKPSYFAGVSAQLKYEHAVYTFQLLSDLVESDGNELVAQVSKSFKLNKELSLTPSAGMVYQDDKLVDYYYGVQANEVAAGRPLYAGKGTINYNITLNANWNLSQKLDLLGQVKYERLGDGISDSPIVDNDSTVHYTLGLVYRFR